MEYNKQSLLQHAIAVALESGMGPVITVLGSNHDLLKKNLQDSRIDIVNNKDWQEGIASSIRCGLNFLQTKYPEADAAIFMVCDQPFVTSSLLTNLLTVQNDSGKAIAACEYAGNTGTPALFHKSMFPELEQLNGDTGARKIIRKNLASAVSVPFPQGNIDIDTSGDYSNLLNSGF